MITIICPHCNEVISLKSITISDIDEFPIVLAPDEPAPETDQELQPIVDDIEPKPVES